MQKIHKMSQLFLFIYLQLYIWIIMNLYLQAYFNLHNLFWKLIVIFNLKNYLGKLAFVLICRQNLYVFLIFVQKYVPHHTCFLFSLQRTIEWHLTQNSLRSRVNKHSPIWIGKWWSQFEMFNLMLVMMSISFVEYQLQLKAKFEN